MRSNGLSVLLALTLAPALAHAQPVPSLPVSGALTPQRVFASPSLSGPVARGVEASPDGALVAFLKPEPTDQFKLDLWIAPAQAGAEPRLLVAGEKVEPTGQAISADEKARRERQRTGALSGVVDYRWDEQGRQIVIPAGGDLYLVDATSGAVRKLPTRASDNTDARFSPSGRAVSYVRDKTLYVMNLADGTERMVSPEGQGPVSYGTAEFVAQEEMDRYTGYWWAEGDRAIAYTRVDESPVELAPRLEIGVSGATVDQQRYPKAGTPNALVSLYVQPLGSAGGAPVEVDLGPDTNIYVARVHWSADGRTLYVERESRDQTRLDLLEVDPATGASRVALSEHQQPWIDLNDDFYALKDGDFVWGSQRSGFNHLYLYTRDGHLVRQLTHGDWDVAGSASGAGAHAPGVAGVDEAKGLVYFLASKETPIERQLYAVSLRHPDEPHAITSGHGWWTATMPKSAGSFVGYYSDSTTPPQTALYGVDGVRRRWIEQNALDPSHPFYRYADRYPAPEFGTLKAEDGQTLYYILMKPVGFDPAKRYPAIVEVYGGPGVQAVTRAWRAPNEKLYLEAGYVLFQLDNRGSANRGLAFQAPIHLRMGFPEVDDQLVGIEHLRSLPYVSDRIGVSGWSYGGYMTLRMLTDPRLGLVAGASGAPPTDWRFYDTHYSEQYMGLPQSHQDAYTASSILPRLPDLGGRLLLMQGMADDNVQFTNSIEVMAALQSMGRPFDLMLYPGQRHGIAGEMRQLQLWRTYLQFFHRELGGANPPP